MWYVINVSNLTSWYMNEYEEPMFGHAWLGS